MSVHKGGAKLAYITGVIPACLAVGGVLIPGGSASEGMPGPRMGPLQEGLLQGVAIILNDIIFA